MKRYLGNKTAIAIFILPALILFTVMAFYPMCQIFVKSLTKWNGVSPAEFIGLKNFQRLLKDPIFYTSLKNGIIYALVQVVLQMVIGTVLALGVADAAVRCKKLLRVAYFIPAVLSVTVVCQLWLSMYNADTGLINKLFEVMGLSYRQNWLSDEKYGIVAIAVVTTWQFMGNQFILLLTAIRSIPEQYLEAARLDGCSKIQAHRYITIPLLQETYRYCLVISITGGLNAFSAMYIMTGGGPGTATYSMSFLMYRAAFRLGEYGYGCAAAVFLITECMIVTFVINRLVARERITYC